MTRRGMPATLKAFLEELRTQHIYRIAGGYMVSSWLILQIASLLCSALGLPNWTLKAILALLLIGFGAALIIGWRIDLRGARLEPFGVPQRSSKVHLAVWPAAAMLIVGGTILVVSAFLDANQKAKSPSSELQSATPAVESSTPIPEITLTDGTHVSVGEQEVLLGDNALGLQAMPSEGIGVIENRPGRVRLLLGARYSTYLVEGTDVQHLTGLPRLVLSPGDPGEFDNGAAEAFAVVRSGTKLYAFYQAEDQEGLPANTLFGVSGFYLSIGLAESDDDGYTWVKKGQIIRCAKPKEWAIDPHQGGRGVGLPGGLADASGKYFYIYYTDLSTPQGGTGGQISVARASLENGPPLPGNWKKYFQGDFTEPGLGGKETPIIDLYSSGHSGARYGRPTYSESLKKYVMVFNVNRAKEWKDALPPETSGIYLALSDDLVRWSSQVKLVSGYAQRVLGKPVKLAPTILFDPNDKPSGWLIYAYSPKLSTPSLANLGTPTYMVGRRIVFARKP
jgi:hypothetical protein